MTAPLYAQALLREYALSNDRAEALHCLRDLGVPAFHHELVRQALMFVFQEPSAKAKIMNLLKAVADSGIVPQVRPFSHACSPPHGLDKPRRSSLSCPTNWIALRILDICKTT